MEMNKPYIFQPKPYYHYSGGVRALHYLCHYLNERGYPAFMTSYPTNPRLNTPYIDERKARLMIEREGAIAVYSERTDGNPYEADRVVRILFHKKGYFDHDIKHGENDIVFAYIDSLKVDKNTPVLEIPAIERELFNNNSNYSKRWEMGYFVGKGKIKDTSYKGEELSVDAYPTREAFADKLRRLEYLTCYDDYSLIIWEARLCGTPVLLYLNEFDEAHVIRNYGNAGIAFTADGLDMARKTVNEASGLYDMKEKTFSMQLENFIKLTQ